jgi:hypothetical protein
MSLITIGSSETDTDRKPRRKLNLKRVLGVKILRQ